MNRTRPNARRGAALRQQRGISLIVSLVLLVVVTLLALGSMRSVVLQTRMSGTAVDRSMAFEGAEAALREAERRAAAATNADIPAADCASGFCAMPAVGDTPRWQDANFNGWRAAGVTTPAPASAVVEDMGDAPNWVGCENEIPRQPNCSTRRYQVTARGGNDGRAQVQVQSQFAAP